MCFYTFYLTNLSLWVNGNIQLETNKETQQTQQTTSFHNFAPHMFWTLTRYQDSSFFSSLRNKVSHAWVRKGQKTESRMREKIITNKFWDSFSYPALKSCSFLGWYTFRSSAARICLGITWTKLDANTFTVRISDISIPTCTTRIASLQMKFKSIN